MTCRLCSVSTMRRHPDHSCAFEDVGDGLDQEFCPSNWMCATMLLLRDRCLWRHREDLSAGSIGVLPIPDAVDGCRGYLVLAWYKDRGSTGRAYILNEDDDAEPLLLSQAEAILEATKTWGEAAP